jgi:hypothetical protein
LLKPLFAVPLSLLYVVAVADAAAQHRMLKPFHHLWW